MVKSVKLTLGEETRRVAVEHFVLDGNLPGWDAFTAGVQQLFGSQGTVSLKIQYYDSDGDLITVSSQTELEEAFRSPCATLHVVLTELKLQTEEADQVASPEKLQTTSSTSQQQSNPQVPTPRQLAESAALGAVQAKKYVADVVQGWWNWTHPLATLVQQAEKFRNAGDSQGAVAVFTSAMKDPRWNADGDARFYYGVELCRNGQYQEAATQLATAASLGFDDLKKLTNEASIEPRREPLQSALTDITKAVVMNMLNKVKPGPKGQTFVGDNVNRILVHVLANYNLPDRLQRARILGIVAVRVFPSSAVLWYNLACIDSLCLQLETAIVNISMAINCGYNNWKHIADDNDLQNLRDSALWAAVVEDIIKEHPQAATVLRSTTTLSNIQSAATAPPLLGPIAASLVHIPAAAVAAAATAAATVAAAASGGQHTDEEDGMEPHSNSSRHSNSSYEQVDEEGWQDVCDVLPSDCPLLPTYFGQQAAMNQNKRRASIQSDPPSGTNLTSPCQSSTTCSVLSNDSEDPLPDGTSSNVEDNNVNEDFVELPPSAPPAPSPTWDLDEREEADGDEVDESIHIPVDPQLQALVDMGFDKTPVELEQMLKEQNGDATAVIAILLNT